MFFLDFYALSFLAWLHDNVCGTVTQPPLVMLCIGSYCSTQQQYITITIWHRFGEINRCHRWHNVGSFCHHAITLLSNWRGQSGLDCFIPSSLRPNQELSVTILITGVSPQFFFFNHSELNRASICLVNHHTLVLVSEDSINLPNSKNVVFFCFLMFIPINTG